MENSKISVIIPVYKVEAYLPRCLDSVINQTYKNLEIILVDDGSPDKSGEICDKYAALDERIKVIHQENRGLSEARNSGMNIATGDYIAFVDSDDWIESDTYEGMLKNIIEHDADLVVCGLWVHHSNGNIDKIGLGNGVETLSQNEFLCKLVSMQDGTGYAWNKLYNRKTLGKLQFLTSDGCSEDIRFNYRFTKNATKIIYIHELKYHYERREGAITKGEFCYNAFSIVDATRSFVEGEKDNATAYPYCIKGFTNSAYTVLSGVITNKKCEDRFDGLVKEILSYRKDILFGKLHNFKDKIRVIILSISPSLYKHIIRAKRSM
ncbi:MAG: glycosyltransferase family 2 protein [Clostridia bacterium]|nr:glycosyltransferase family 2 protein [Clostridia bacterium]